MKRPLLIIAIFLLLGAAVNVAVAWGCTAWGWSRPRTRVDPAGYRLALQRVWDQYSPEGSPPFKRPYIATNWGWTVVAAYYYPPSSPGDGFVVGELKVGSPIRTFQCGWYHPFEDASFVMFKGWRTRDKPSLVVPYDPIWPGHAINTLFYATLLWLPSGSFALRRFLRVRRGLCPKCAYPMGESSVCTECGGLLPPQLVSAP